VPVNQHYLQAVVDVSAELRERARTARSEGRREEALVWSQAARIVGEAFEAAARRVQDEAGRRESA